MNLEPDWYIHLPIHYSEIQQKLLFDSTRINKTCELFKDKGVTLDNLRTELLEIVELCTEELDKKVTHFECIEEVEDWEFCLLSISELVTCISRLFETSKNFIREIYKEYNKKYSNEHTTGYTYLMYLLFQKRKDVDFKIPVYKEYNGYKQIKHIGEGSYGDVLIVEKDGKQYADKMILEDDIDFDEMDLYYELQTPKWKHVGICAPIETFQEQSTYHVIMELAKNNIYKHISTKSPHYKLRLKWCYDITLAVQFFHNKGYYHGDIKPENILLFEDGRVQLADYSLSFDNHKFIKGDIRCMGTPCWTSPEGLLMEHWKEYKGEYLHYYRQAIYPIKVEIFSLGLLFAYVLCYKKMIRYEKNVLYSYNEFIKNHEEILNDVEMANVKILLKKMLQLDVTKRMGSIEEVLQSEIFASL